MKYGYFDDKKKEYIINSPNTPLPWINYLGNKDFFSLISNTFGGFSFYKDARLRRLTRYRYNSVPRDSGGRLFYIKEGNTIWNPCYRPCNIPLDYYICAHGLGYTRVESKKNEINCSILAFVPQNDSCEINEVTITNNSNKNRTFTFYSCLEWCFYDAVDDQTNFQRNLNIGEVEVDGSTLYHTTEYRERRNHYCFYSVNTPIDGYDTDRDSFLGSYNGWHNPEKVMNGTSGFSIASGWSPIASHRIELTLQPNETKSFIFLLGYIEIDKSNKFDSNGRINKIPAKNLIAKYSTTEKVKKAFLELSQYWDNLLNKFQVYSEDEKFNRAINIWNQYQCMVTFNLSRSTSYFESGTGRGMGFRDSCQDILGFVHMISKRARSRIIDIASIQFKDGSTYHQYQPLTKRGNSDIGSGFNDDPLWLIACTIAYIKETGDFSILKELVPYDNKKGSEEPLFEHLKKSINYTLSNLGSHGLPLIGRADWNDCLNLNCFSNTPGESFQTCSNCDNRKAESVFIAAMFCLYGKEYALLCDELKLYKEQHRIIKAVKTMENNIIEHAWDGEWFLRAYDNSLNKVGSSTCDEGSIFIEPQGFCSMAEIGKDKNLGKISLQSVRRYLENDFGIELLHPCYSTYRPELGEISSYPQGYKENGSVFSHNNPWIILGFTSFGDDKSAFEIFKKICPTYIEEQSDIRKVEPYVYCQTTAGRDAKKYGEGKNSWLTGTAAWSFVASSQGILGIKPDYCGLNINPCVPKELGNIKIVRVFREVTYTINIIRHETKKGIFFENNKILGNIIPYNSKKKEQTIDVYI